MPGPDATSARLEALERENTRLRRSVQELSLLNDLAREIGASSDPDEIMRKIVRRALKSVQAEQGVITLVEEQAGDPMKTFVRTAGSSVKQSAYQLNDSVLGWMHLYKQPLVINDPASDSRFLGTRWDTSVTSMVCVPLIIRSHLMGIMTVFNKRLPTGFSEDDQRLLAIIAAQSAQIIENARLQKEEKALIGMREELRLANQIQTSLLPDAPPDVPGYDIDGTSRPAQTVGGDYYDYIALEDGCLAVCLGDVSGKGLPASLLMANVQATLRGQALWTDSAGLCLERSNKLLCQSIRRGTFVTLFYSILDPRTHRVSYANAGHNRPLLVADDGSVTRLTQGGLVLGFLPSQAYHEATHTLAPGDTLLIFSDGITEAMNPAREQFGEQQLTDVVKAHRHESASTIIDRIVDAAHRFAASAPQADDMTLLVVKRLA